MAELEEKKTTDVLKENLSVLATPDGFQRYILGTKKNGQARAVYDVVKDYTTPKKKKKKHKKKKQDDIVSAYSCYTSIRKKDKKKGKKKKKKHWHI